MFAYLWGQKNYNCPHTNIIIHAENPLVTTLEGSGPHYLKINLGMWYFKVFKGIPRDIYKNNFNAILL